MSSDAGSQPPPGNDAPIPIAEDAAWKRHTQIEALVGKQPDPPCPACQRLMPADSTVCVHCGFDKRVGYTRATGIGATSRKGGTTKCSKCGYDLTGLKRPICPECGNKKIFQTDSERREAEAKQAEKELWLVPLVMIGVSLVVVTGYCINLGGLMGLAASVAWVVTILVGTIGGFAGFVMAAAIMVGWTYGVGHTFLRLLAIMMVVSAVSVFIPSGFGLIGLIISVAIIYGLLIRLLDQDSRDAGIVTVLVIIGQYIGFIVGAILAAFVASLL